MSTISVYRPDLGESDEPAFSLAPRGKHPDRAHLLIVDNAKPRGKALMTRVAERVRDRLRVAEVEVYTKISAGKALDADETRMLAARSHLVISGLGD